jgi:hypothetical protein
MALSAAFPQHEAPRPLPGAQRSPDLRAVRKVCTALSARRLAFAPSFGCGMGLGYVAGWMALERAVTDRTLAAAATIGGAAALSAALALIAAHLLRRRPWSARFAATLILLLGGTVGFASVAAGTHLAWSQHSLLELPLHITALILAIQIAATLYGFLALAAPLVLPLALPLIAAFAVLIARHPR